MSSMKISTNLNVPLAFVKKSAKKLNTHTTNTHKAQKMVMVVSVYVCVCLGIVNGANLLLKC